MIIAGFGDSVATMYTFPTALMDDSYAAAAPQATKAVPLASGVLDVRGATPNAIAALTVDKSFVLITTPTADTTSATYTITNPGTHSGNVGHVDIVPGSVVVNDISGTGADDGTGNLIDSALNVRGSIDYTTGGYSISTTFLDPPITSLDFTYISGYTPKWADLGTAIDALRTATIARGESKLWALMRDGTYRWTWAKCVQFKAPERVGQINHAPVALKFVARSGLWYGETLNQVARDGVLTEMTNLGNTIAPVTVRVTAVGAPCTAFEYRSGDGSNQVVFAGSVAVGKTMVLDSAKWSAKNDGVGAFANLTLVGTGPWLYLRPGDDGIYQWSITGGNPTVVYEYYDTWVM